MTNSLLRSTITSRFPFKWPNTPICNAYFVRHQIFSRCLSPKSGHLRLTYLVKYLRTLSTGSNLQDERLALLLRIRDVSVSFPSTNAGCSDRGFVVFLRPIRVNSTLTQSTIASFHTFPIYRFINHPTIRRFITNAFEKASLNNLRINQSIIFYKPRIEEAGHRWSPISQHLRDGDMRLTTALQTTW
jgi:hypothetical protein